MSNLLHVLSSLRADEAKFRSVDVRTHIEHLLRTFFPESMASPPVSAILRFLLDGQPLGALPPNPQDAVFFSHLEEIRRFAFADGAPSAPRFLLETGEIEDCLVPMVDQWSALKLVSFLLLQSIRPSKRFAIVATARDEGLSILEWIAFHRILGFEAFFVYTNDNTDGSLELLEQLAHNGIITLIKNRVSAKVSPQQKCYEHSLFCLPQLRDYRWVSYLDIDEFLLPLNEGASTVGALVEQFERTDAAKSASAVYFNWKWFGSGQKFAMEDGLVLERFHDARPDPHGKCLSRLRDIVSMRPVHYPTLFPNCAIADSSFKLVADVTKVSPVYGKGQINHYWNKSFEEFALKKVRGLPSQGIAGKQRDFEHFFTWDAVQGSARTEDVPLKLLNDTKAEYARLLALPGIEDRLIQIRRRARARVDGLDAEYDLKEIFRNRGAVKVLSEG